MTSAPSWTAHLKCGHDVPTQGKPTPGNWLSCLTPGCWRQAEIASVSPVLTVAPRLVQGALWELAELEAAA